MIIYRSSSIGCFFCLLTGFIKKQKYKIVYANGTEETDHSLINIAKNAIIDLKTKYHTIERKIKHQVEGFHNYDDNETFYDIFNDIFYVNTVYINGKPSKAKTN